MTPESTAWIQTHDWLADAKPSQNPFCKNNGSVYYCDFTRSNGSAARLLWDSKYGQKCSNMSPPIVCGNTQYEVPASFSKGWIDLGGAAHPYSKTVKIGANPILLEQQ